MTARVREAEAADAAEIVRLKAEIMTSAYPFDVELDQHPEWPERARATVLRMIEHPDYVFLVVDAEGSGGDAARRLVGSISVGLTWHVPGPNWGPIHAHLGDMCTDPEVRGTGVGRALMDAAIEWCREHDVHGAWLDATPSAVPVYERMGFARQEGPELFPTMWRMLRD